MVGRVSSLSIGLAAAFGAAADAQPAIPVTLAPEEEISLQLSGEGARIVGLRHAEWREFEVGIARTVVDSLHGRAPAAQPDPRLDPPVTAGEVRLRLLSVAGQQTLLMVENGYDQAFTYRAVITRSGRSEPTSVCVVLPNIRGIEYWPYPVERIALSDFLLAPYDESQGITCQ